VQGCNPGGNWNTSCGSDGGGNLADTDPLLVDPPDPTAAPTGVGDSRLSLSSPAIDAGDNARYPDLANATDLDGNARLLGAAIDIGAFEFSLVTLARNVNGSGNVQAQPDQASYELGESVELTAVAAAGWTFDGWSGAASGESNPVTVVLDTATTDVTAIFRKEPPIADAGPDQAVGISIPATLDASASFDEDPAAVLSYAWTQTAGETVTLDDSTAVQPAFVAPAQPDELQFVVVVSNDSGVFAVDVTEVTVATAPYTIGGTVSGLKRPGLELSLNSGASVLRFDVDNAYVFPPTFADGDTWTAAIIETPADHNCQLSRLNGTIDAASMTDLNVTCVTGITFTDRFEALAPDPVIVND
jgi:uncharacterized repeat protein (TIGR02543 family)